VLRIASDQHCGQGNNRGHQQRCLGQACLHIFDLLTHAGQPDHRHERQVPKEDESLGALGPPAELLQVILSPAPGAHQGQAAQPDVVEPVVDHHVRDGVGDRHDQHHVGPVAGQVVTD